MLNRKNSIIAAIIAVVIVAGVAAVWFRRSAGTERGANPTVIRSVYDVEARDIDGNLVRLDQYRGKALLIVNVASKCRFTPQYEGLQRLYDKYQSRGLVVLGFPANNFAWREPGTDAEIKEFSESIVDAVPASLLKQVRLAELEAKTTRRARSLTRSANRLLSGAGIRV